MPRGEAQQMVAEVMQRLLRHIEDQAVDFRYCEEHEIASFATNLENCTSKYQQQWREKHDKVY